MCFYNEDCDWVAIINEKKFVRSDSQAKCYECNRQIAAGEWRAEAYQQEHEMCQVCEDSESDDYISNDPDDYGPEQDFAAFQSDLASHKHKYGETFSCSICRDCCLILEAIYDLEAKEGCPEYARQPSYGELSEVIGEDQGKWGDRKYTNHAIQKFPELSEHFLRL